MNNQNWPQGVNRGHSNWTGRTARRYEGKGAWANDSHDMPVGGWIGGVIFALVFVGLLVVL